MPIERHFRQGLERFRTSVQEIRQKQKAEKILFLTRAIINEDSISSIIANATRLGRTVYTLSQLLPSHKKENTIPERGLAEFIKYQLILRRANLGDTRKHQQLARDAGNAMNSTALMPKVPRQPDDRGQKAVPGSLEAYKEKAKQLGGIWAAMTTISDPNQTVRHPQAIIDGLEQALQDLSESYPHTPSA